MIKAVFITAHDQRVEAEGAVGDNLLRLGQAAGMPLEGTCEGQMACSRSEERRVGKECA